jgi:hypothetical protein
LREKRRLRVFENRMLRRIFGFKRDDVTGEWRKLHNEELHDLYSSLNIVWMIKSRRMRCSRALPEKLTGSQPVNKFPALCGTSMFIAAFTNARHLLVFQAISVQYIPHRAA